MDARNRSDLTNRSARILSVMSVLRRLSAVLLINRNSRRLKPGPNPAFDHRVPTGKATYSRSRRVFGRNRGLPRYGESRIGDGGDCPGDTQPPAERDAGGAR
jgi:hypothetical protein